MVIVLKSSLSNIPADLSNKLVLTSYGLSSVVEYKLETNPGFGRQCLYLNPRLLKGRSSICPNLIPSIVITSF